MLRSRNQYLEMEGRFAFPLIRGRSRTAARMTYPAPWDRADIPEGQPEGLRPTQRRQARSPVEKQQASRSPVEGQNDPATPGEWLRRSRWGDRLSICSGLVSLCQLTERIHQRSPGLGD
jgi:hypothetical protein